MNVYAICVDFPDSDRHWLIDGSGTTVSPDWHERRLFQDRLTAMGRLWDLRSGCLSSISSKAREDYQEGQVSAAVYPVYYSVVGERRVDGILLPSRTRLETIRLEEAQTFASEVYRREKVFCTIDEIPRPQ